MKVSLLLISFWVYSNFLVSQSLSSYWAMGYYSYTQFYQQGGSTIYFTGTSVDTSKYHRPMNFEYANASICDSSGNLLFYTNGVYIANAQDDTMPNGSGLNPSWYTNSWSVDGLKIQQADVIIPKPGHDSIYYLFHETMDFTNLALFRSNYLYQTEININLDSLRGAVTSKNNIIITDTLITGGLTACKHANGRDWWILVPTYGIKAGFYTLLITPDTIEMVSFNTFNVTGLKGGTLCFSPDGSKFIWNNWWEVDFFSFDRCSGALVLIDDTLLNMQGWFGCSISPNSRYGYISHGDSILQYDLDAADISASVQVVASYDGFQGPLPTKFWMHQLGPDGKIYINTGNSTFYLHTIDAPDSAGVACNVQQHSLQMPTYNVTIPNFPNYDLGVLPGSPCDTLGLSTPNILQKEISVRLSPNPATNSFYIKYEIPTNENLVFVMYDSYGNEVLRKTLYGTFKNLLVHTEQLSNGIYFWRAIPSNSSNTQPSKGKPSDSYRNVGFGVNNANGKIVILH